MHYDENAGGREATRTSYLVARASLPLYFSIPMSSQLVSYLLQRTDAATFLLPADFRRTIEDIFDHPDAIVPAAYKIFPADETQSSSLGFPVAEMAVV